MTSHLLSRSSSDSCSFLLSSFSSSESAHVDPLADLPPPSSAPDALPASTVAIFEQDPAIDALPDPPFLTSQASSSLDVLSLDLITSISDPDQGIAAGTASCTSSSMCAGGVGRPPQCDMAMEGSEVQVQMPAPEELSILQESQLNTPTMHPNLVSTLKSIICPSSSPRQEPHSLSEGQERAPQQEPHSLSKGQECKASLGSVSALNMAFPQLPALFVHPLSAPAIVEKALQPKFGQKQPQHAAIVPIHLIQNRRPYRCSYGGCNKTFKNPQTLKMHHKTHCSNNGPSDSDACGRGRLMHSLATIPQSCKAGQNKKIPSRCPICKRAFVGLYELRRHFGRKHSEGEKAHACSKCGKRFYIEVDLRDHQKLCGEPLLCKCGMKFAFKCNLVAHKKTHLSCQEDNEQHKYNHHAQDATNGAMLRQVHGDNPLSVPQGDTKAFFCSHGESTCILPAGVEMAALNCNASDLQPSSSQFIAYRPQMYRPIVKSEYSSLSAWSASAALGVSRAL